MEEAAEPRWVPRSRWKGVEFVVMLAEAARRHPRYSGVGALWTLVLLPDTSDMRRARHS